MYAVALSVVKNWEEEEDLTQESLLVAWSNLGKLRAPGAFLTCLRRITRNLALSWARSDEFRRGLSERYSLDRDKTTHSAPKSTLDESDRRSHQSVNYLLCSRIFSASVADQIGMEANLRGDALAGFGIGVLVNRPPGNRQRKRVQSLPVNRMCCASNSKP